MDSKMKLKNNVIIIILGILILAFAIQITHSDFILRFSSNQSVNSNGEVWKPQVPDPSVLEPSGELYCIGYDSSEPVSVAIKSHIQKTLGVMKTNLQIIDVKSEVLPIEKCSVIISAVSSVGSIGNPDIISNFVKTGGYFLQSIQMEQDDFFYRLYRKMGIISTGLSIYTQGIDLVENVLFSEKGLRFNADFINNASTQVELDPHSRVLARSYSGIPLLWDIPYGNGKFMIFNGSILQEKINRGLIAGMVSLLKPDFIYPVFNSKLIYIDDFPAPISKQNDENILKQYNRNISSFFKDVWWPDMIKLAKRYDIKYSAVLIESYNDQVVPPFTDPLDADSKELISYGRELIKSGGEIGLHGFNHQSLQTDPDVASHFEYNPWPGIDEMVQSVKEALRYMAEGFPNYTMQTYVPPSNVLDSDGREALKQAWPNLGVIASLFPEDPNGNAYEQEFEIAVDGIVEMPRITAGYVEDDYLRWIEANIATAHGYISHFVHPDDVLSKDRNHNLNWNEMYEKLSELLARQKQTYPWMRSMTSIEAAMNLEQFLNSRVDWTRDSNRIMGTISPFKGLMCFVIRTDRSIRDTRNCSITKIDKSTYLITAKQSQFEVILGE